MGIVIGVEVTVAPGVDIYSACRELIELSKRLSVRLNTSFNGTQVFIFPNSNVDKLVDEWWKQQSEMEWDEFTKHD